MFVNNSEIPLAQQGSYALKDGDRIRMGDYDILVSLDERGAAAAGAHRLDEQQHRCTGARPEQQ